MRLFPLLLCLALAAVAQEEGPPQRGAGPQEPINATTFASLRARNIGPAFISGRVTQVAVFPDDSNHYLVAEASGNIFLTYNNGTTWTPVFDNQGSYSIGYVAIDPKNPSIVWVGTGENNNQRSVSYGDGVYKSEDAGRTWRNVGLRLPVSLTTSFSSTGGPNREKSGARPLMESSSRTRPACRSGIAWRSSRGNAMVLRRTRRRAGTFFRVSSVLIGPV